MKILFITANRVGDAVLTTGVLTWLVTRYPEARFTIACGPYAADLFRAVPRLDRLIVMRKQGWNRHWFGLWRQCATVGWDLIVDFRDSAVSRLLFAKRRAFRAHGTGLHKVIENARILNIEPPPAPQLFIDETAQAEAAHLVPGDRPVIAFAPAANWTIKQWPIERFTLLAQRLTLTGGLLPKARVMVVADERERAQIAPLLQALPDGQGIEIIGNDLLTVAACLKRATVFVGNDSGLMHISAAVGTPTIGMFGPGYEHIYGPWGAQGAFVRTPESRDYLLERLKEEGFNQSLMQGLSVESVVEAVRSLLAKVK